MKGVRVIKKRCSLRLPGCFRVWLFFGEGSMLLVELPEPTRRFTLVPDELPARLLAEETEPLEIPLNLEESDESGESSEASKKN